MTIAFLKQHPKVYWIWNHRRWCLENVPDGPPDGDPNGWRQTNWNKELFVVEKMLDADARNCELDFLRTDPRVSTGRDDSYFPASYGLELSPLCFGDYGRPKIRIFRTCLYHPQNRGELFQLQRMASTIEGSDVPLGIGQVGSRQV